MTSKSSVHKTDKTTDRCANCGISEEEAWLFMFVGAVIGFLLGVIVGLVLK